MASDRFSIGTDIVDIQRMKELSDRESFFRGSFTEKELEYINDRDERAAGIFAAKEAASKALGTGFRGFMPRDIEVYHDKYGAPKLRLYGRAKEILGDRNIEISISHSRLSAIAVVAVFIDKLS